VLIHLLSSVDPVLYCDTNGQLTRQLFCRLLHRLLQRLLLASLGPLWGALHRLVSQSGVFTPALLQQLRCYSLHSSCFTPCCDLINSGEIYNCTQPIIINGSIMSHQSGSAVANRQSTTMN
jgi:hypothetical protein